MKAFWHIAHSHLLKSWSPWVGWAHNRGHYFICVYILWKRNWSLRTSRSISIKLGRNHAWVAGIQICPNKETDPLQRRGYHKSTENNVGSRSSFKVINLQNSTVAIIILIVIANYHWPICWMICFMPFVTIHFHTDFDDG
jgi:hypothetical protein